MDDIQYCWRGPVTDAEMVDLVTAHGGQTQAGWWDQVRPHCLGWVTARTVDGLLVGFVNVAWDGGDHAVLPNTKVRREYQRRGIATKSSAWLSRIQRRRGVSCFTSISRSIWRGSTSKHAASSQPRQG